jgi:hypothetical protein
MRDNGQVIINVNRKINFIKSKVYVGESGSLLKLHSYRGWVSNMD